MLPISILANITLPFPVADFQPSLVSLIDEKTLNANKLFQVKAVNSMVLNTAFGENSSLNRQFMWI